MKQSRFILFSVLAIIILIVVVVVLVVLLNPSISPITVFAATETATPTSTLTPIPTATPTETPIPPTATASATFTALPSATQTFSPVPPTLTPTNTLTPSNTPTITPTPTATPIERVLVEVVGKIVVFRDGPGTVYTVLSRLNRGGKILLSGISEDAAWYMFKYADANAWISADPTVTKVLEGNPLHLPVFPAPATPTPGPTKDRKNVDQLDWRYCVFDNNMSEEAQNNLVDQMYNGANNDDWRQAGQAARHVYLCAAQAAFYVLYAQVYQNKTAVGTEPMEMNTAMSLFLDGWYGTNNDSTP